MWHLLCAHAYDKTHVMFLTRPSSRLAIFIACYVARAGEGLGTRLVRASYIHTPVVVDQPARPPRCCSTAESFVGHTEVVGARTAEVVAPRTAGAGWGSTAGLVDSPTVLVVGRPWLALRC